MWPSATVPHVDLWENKTHSSVADFRSRARAGWNAKKKEEIFIVDSISRRNTRINLSPSLYIYMGTIAFED